ncbi:STP1 protein, partial [Plasmodium malariae]
SLNVRSSGFLMYVVDRNFIKIRQYVTSKTATLSNKSDKQTIRKVCRDLSKYLIEKKSPPSYYRSSKDTWEGAIKNWVRSHYENVDIHGKCPVVMNESDMELLELKYKEEEFCEKRSTYMNKIKLLKRGISNTCDDEYLNICNEYNNWIDAMKIYFETITNRFRHCYRKKPNKGKRRQSQEIFCDVFQKETFTKTSHCLPINKIPSCRTLPEKKSDSSQESDQEKDKLQLKSEVSMEISSETPPRMEILDVQKAETEEQFPKEQKSQSDAQSLTETSSSQDKSTSIPAMQIKPNVKLEGSTQDNIENTVSPGSDTLANSNSEGSGVSPAIETNAPSAQSLIYMPGSANSTEIWIFKKKKKIKRRQVKFLKILTPNSLTKNEFVKHDNIEYPLYDDDEITKQIRILEHNKNNNINASKQKKYTYKTIIEVHMQILEEYRNEEWEYVKGEFLEICLELLTKGEHNTYPYLTNDELIMGNTKKREKLKNDPDEIQNIPFSQREKDIWRQWISEKCIIIKQYIEQDLFNYLTNELQIIPDDYDNEKIKDSLPLINIGELSNKEDCQELYKYIKKKLLTKLCIFVLMSVLEECKKEQDIEENESHFDNYIIEFKEKENSDSKKEFIENISDFNRNFLGSMENTDYTTDDSFRKKLENWIIEDNTNANSMRKENTADKYY